MKPLVIRVVMSLALGLPILSGQVTGAPTVIHVGVILDGPSARNTWILREFEQQLTGFFVPEYDVRFVPEFTVTADWTVAGIRSGIDKLLAHPDVEIVLALGAVSSHEIAHRQNLPKPAIAAFVIDAQLQELPVKDGTSGVKNLNYLSSSYSATRTITQFRKMVPFKKLGVLIEPVVLEGVPQLGPHITEQLKSIGVDVLWIPTTSPQDAHDGLTSDVDAVYVAPLNQLSEEDFRNLITDFITRKLPSFSYIGRTEVELGILASYAPGSDITRRARRVAINMQRILNGADAGTLPVDFSSASQLTINMQTARAIGFYPDWNTLTEADLIHTEELSPGRTLSLNAAVQEAVQANLNYKAAQKIAESGREEVHKKRAPLLPQLNASAKGILVRRETAESSFGSQAERQVQGELTLEQSIYSDQSWANYSVERHLQNGRESDQQREHLDVSLDAATAYLNVLRAKTVAQIQRSNLKLTISNLELAQQREAVGASGKSDVYRWESQAATSKKNVITADAQVHLAQIEVNHLLARPLEEQFGTQEVALTDPSLITGEPRLFKYFANERTFAVFRDFMVQEGFEASPELKKLDEAIAAEERVSTAAGRSFWMPEIGVQANLRNIFSRSGAGSEGLSLPSSIPITLAQPPELTWSIALQATLPLFQGAGRIAALEQSNIDLERLALERQEARQLIEQRVRGALHTAGASFASIEQTRNAADASTKNLELITDAYSRGATSIVTLLDAQNAALVSSEAAENAVYDFIVDLMNVERAIGTFDFFRSADEREAYFKRLDEFYRNAGVKVE